MISGGPFVMVEADELEPTYRLKEAYFWNFGDNHPGGGMGVYFNLARPVFFLKYNGQDVHA